MLFLPLQSSPQKSVAALAYPDTETGLQNLLQAALQTARAGNDNGLAALVSGTEIPDFKQWVINTFGAEAGNVWADPDATGRTQNEESHRNLLTALAHGDGEIVVHRLKDEPNRDGSFVYGNLACLDRPLEIYYAGWRPAGQSDSSDGSLVGFFIFIDGAFRWGTGINYANGRCIEGPKPRTILSDQQRNSSVPVSKTGDEDGPFFAGIGGVGFPKCIRCPDPVYPPDPRKFKIQGAVSLIITVEADGQATDVKVVESLGPEMDKAAIDTVRSWQFQPANGPNGKSVASIIGAEIDFRLL
jgi:TonB family protein